MINDLGLSLDLLAALFTVLYLAKLVFSHFGNSTVKFYRGNTIYQNENKRCLSGQMVARRA